MTRLRATWSYAAVVALVLIFWVVAAAALATVWTSSKQIINHQDSFSEQNNLVMTAMVNQESSLRGYLLTGDPVFLQPYQAGRRVLDRYLEGLRSLPDNAAERRLTVLVTQRAHRWQQWAAIQLRGRGGSPVSGTALTARELTGKRLFDAFRQAIAQLNTRLHGERVQRVRMNDDTFVWALGILSALGLGAAIAVSLLARRNYRLYTGEQEARRAAEQAADALRISEERYRTVVETSPDGILTADLSGRIVLSNQCGAALLGYDRPDDLIGLPAPELVVPADRPIAWQNFQKRATLEQADSRNMEYTILRRDGSSFPAEVSSSALVTAEGKPAGVTLVVRDITARKAAEAQLRYLAMHDGLTGLPNRTVLLDRLRQALTAAQRAGEQAGLLLLDLDRFKEINDTFGHHFGDRLLQQLGPRLESALREGDTVARLGGDEFAILLPSTDEFGAVDTAEQVIDAVRRPFSLDDQELDISASAGIVLYPRHGEDADILLQHADAAMYMAKRSGDDYALYAVERDENSARRLTLMGALRRAIDEDQLLLHFQPKQHLGTGRVESAEALVRWRHPELGMIRPDEFIPLMEHTGLVKSMTRWTLRAALEQARVWGENNLDIRVAVNLSARSLHDQQLVQMVADVLRETRAETAWLILEVTEGSVMADATRALDVLSQLDEMGIMVSIDDFGTGYSSLAYLDQLPAGELKIDRSFVQDMLLNEGHFRIVRGTVNIAHELGLSVVAEGVEDQRTLEVLAALGCDLAQGYHLSRPMPSEDATRWLAARRADNPFREEPFSSPLAPPPRP